MKKMKRVVLLVLDGTGIGEMSDAAKFGDKGAEGTSLRRSIPRCPI